MTADSLEAELRAVRADASGMLRSLDLALERAARDGLIDVAFATMDTPIGPLLLAATDSGLVRVAFQREDPRQVLEELAGRVGPRVVAAPARLDGARRELDEYFGGDREHFDLRVDWRLSSGFRKTVLERLRADVPYGRTVSYMDLASMVGNPSAARAVGTAMATNPVPIVIPCHRVLRSGGHLGGYGGGLEAKRTLLELETADPTLF